jgi:hypothetical protein
MAAGSTKIHYSAIHHTNHHTNHEACQYYHASCLYFYIAV